jgi:hypothetical protein
MVKKNFEASRKKKTPLVGAALQFILEDVE